MFQNLRLWAKIMLAMGAAIGIVSAALTFTNLLSMSSVIREAERSALDAHFKAIKNAIAAESRMAETLSAVVANIPLVQEKFSAGDRKALGELFVPGYKLLAAEYGFEQFQFHTPPASSFLRMHMPNKFGDDLSSFRHTVIETNKNQKPTRGLEGGVGGIGARGMVPVMHNGKHLGSVEFGMSFGQPFFENFKKQNGVDSGLYVLDKEGFKTLGSTLGKEPMLAVELLKKALAGEAQLHQREIKDAPHAVYAAAINDFSGKPIGVIEIAMDSSRYQAMLASARTTSIIVGVIAIAFGLLLAMLIARHLVSRINTVVEGVNRIALGDLSVDIALVGIDVISDLARATR